FRPSHNEFPWKRFHHAAGWRRGARPVHIRLHVCRVPPTAIGFRCPSVLHEVSMITPHRVRVAVLAIVVAAGAAAPFAQTSRSTLAKVTSPKEQFGHDIGDDYFLVNYTQYVEYLRKLDQESDRMTVVEIGKTEEGKPELTAIITSPENHKKLAQYR